MDSIISIDDARNLALEMAKFSLRRIHIEENLNILEDFLIYNKRFYMFFRNRNIKIPEPSNELVVSNCAFAIGCYGLTLSIKDNLSNEKDLIEQIYGLEKYFELRDKRN